MIHIELTSKEEYILSIRVNGHSGSNEKGKDLICAGVSCIMFGLCNALDQMQCDCNIDLKDNLISITVNDFNEKTQIILNTAIIQLKTIQETSSQFVEIKNTEV